MASLSEDIAKMVRTIIRKERGNYSTYVQGVFVSEEPVDVNLSVINVLGTEIRFVRKIKATGTLLPGQSVLMVQGGGVPLTIIGVVVGDLTKAEVL